MIENIVFAFNFNPVSAFEGYWMPVSEEGEYEVMLSTDEGRFGGFDRISTTYVYTATKAYGNQLGFKIYLPARTAVCLKKKK